MTDLNLSATELYRVGSAEKVETDALYHITGDTNFYAIANVKEITTQAGLANINASTATLSGNYILLKDIALNQNGAGFEATYGWKPIGDYYDRFTGIFNGNGYKITGFWIDRPSMEYVGLFGYANGATIKNLGVEIPDGKELIGNNYVGGIVGYIAGSITNSYSTGNISGSENVGGIAGFTSGDITNSYTTGDISGTGNYVGGIAGRVYGSGAITNSYATGDISGTSNVGGIAGGASGDITNSYAAGNISGTSNVGGIAGSAYGDITNSAAINHTVSASAYVNKIVGYINGSPTINNNFALNTMSIAPNGSSGNGGDADKTIVELKTQSTYTGLGWLFGNNASNPWKIDANKNGGLPYLYYQDQ
jgi:hypothetical protein